jgi:hypothetical protein
MVDEERVCVWGGVYCFLYPLFLLVTLSMGMVIDLIRPKVSNMS